jgi:hypothetical protein
MVVSSLCLLTVILQKKCQNIIKKKKKNVCIKYNVEIDVISDLILQQKK